MDIGVVGPGASVECLIGLLLDHPAKAKSKSHPPGVIWHSPWQSRIRYPPRAPTFPVFREGMTSLASDTAVDFFLLLLLLQDSANRLVQWSLISFGVLDLPFHCDYKNIYQRIIYSSGALMESKFCLFYMDRQMCSVLCYFQMSNAVYTEFS